MKDGNLFNPWKFQASILKRSRENHVFPKTFQTDRLTDKVNYRVASLLKTHNRYYFCMKRKIKNLLSPLVQANKNCIKAFFKNQNYWSSFETIIIRSKINFWIWKVFYTDFARFFRKLLIKHLSQIYKLIFVILELGSYETCNPFNSVQRPI